VPTFIVEGEKDY